MGIYDDMICDDIKRAMYDIKENYREVVRDISRPKYHFASPAKLLIDVWGGIFYKGYYHLFYDIKYREKKMGLEGAFGHLRSKDFIQWEDLPPILLPEREIGEDQLNDGTIVIDPSGKPLMYYTRDFLDASIDREHVPVRGSDDFISWKRMEDKSLTITMKNHGGPKFHMSWSDPFIFSENNRTFMIISKCTIPGKGGVIPIYEALDDSLLKWQYRGIFAEHTGEVVNFIKVKDKWVLIHSPYQNPKYFVGVFDINSFKFICEKEGILSYGYVRQGTIEESDISRGFYATSSFYGENAVPYIVGWISGFPNPKIWDGCVSLVRTLDIDKDGGLLMMPIPRLKELRTDVILPDADGSVKCGKTFEIDAEVEFESACELEIFVQEKFKLIISENKIKFNDIAFDYQVGKILKIRMYVDVSVAEIFFDDGKASVARCFKELSDHEELEIKCAGKINRINIYKLGELYEKQIAQEPEV